VDITLQAEKTTFVSAYIPPRARNGTDGDREFFEELETAITTLNRSNIIIGMDSNSKSEFWEHQFEDPRGATMKEIIVSHNLQLLNDGATPTFYVEGGGQSFIDLTLCSNALHRRINNWTVS
jgi:hypothetical protein